MQWENMSNNMKLEEPWKTCNHAIMQKNAKKTIRVKQILYFHCRQADTLDISWCWPVFRITIARRWMFQKGKKTISFAYILHDFEG